jgi:hypothetical protein
MSYRKLGIIAGNGNLPFELIKHCKQTNREVFVVGLCPFVNIVNIIDTPHTTAKIAEVGKIFSAFKKNEVRDIVFAGGIQRPSLNELIPDWEGAKLLTKLALNKKSDDSIFRALIAEIEKQGFSVVSAQDVAPELLFSEGVYGKAKPSKDDMDDIHRGIAVSLALGSVDVGQACVVQENMVLAVEAIEGTDMMLSRADSLRRKGKSPIMVKIVKPNQDTRVDLPVIGPQTIDQLHKYKIGGIAVEAGGILLIERDVVIKSANERGIFIIGMKI